MHHLSPNPRQVIVTGILRSCRVGHSSRGSKVKLVSCGHHFFGPVPISAHFGPWTQKICTPFWHWRIRIYDQKMWLSLAYPGSRLLQAHPKRLMDKSALLWRVVLI
ncbi:hypothetical protein TNCV_40381 [Trichonephila clavipes]|nr:hypothetical protein TNCV_40381 [Trichonephila clavipes]